MSLCIFLSTVNALLGRSTFIIVCLSVRPFLGLVVEADAPPMYCIPALWSGWNLPMGFFCYKVYSKHLGLLAETWGIRSIFEGSPFDFQCLIFFRRRFQSCRRTFSRCPFYASCWVFPSARSYERYLILSPGFWYHPLLSERFLWALACPETFPCFLGGSPKFSEVLLCSRERCLWKYSSRLL